MKLLNSLAVITASAGVVRAGALRNRQDAPPGPTDPGISKYCSLYTLSTTTTDSTCPQILQTWTLTIEQFLRWNPAAGTDLASCKLTTGDAYCVKAANEPTPTEPSAGPKPPGATQSGQPTNCDRWDQVNSGNTCDTFTSKYPGLTTEQFIEWNPAVGKFCAGLIIDTYVCTRTVGWVPPTNPTPSPVQPGQIKGCTKWHFVEAGESCAVIAPKYEDLTQSEIFTYNPAVKSDCSGLWANTYLCVETEKGPKHPEVTSTPTTAPPTEPTGIQTPQPVQPGQVKGCTRWYFVQAGETCAVIVPKFQDLTQAEVFSYNTAIKADCSGLWANTYLCVETETSKKHPPVTPGGGGSPTTTIPPDPTTNPTPLPTQPGMIKDCTRFYFGRAGDSCWSITQKFKDLTQNELTRFNPGIKSDCSAMWANAYLCVEIRDRKKASSSLSAKITNSDTSHT